MPSLKNFPPPQEYHAIVYADSKAVLGSAFGYGAIPRLMKPLSGEAVLIALSKINWMLQTKFGEEHLQFDLASQFLSVSATRRVEELLLNRHWTLYFTRQVETLMKFAFLNSKLPTETWTLSREQLLSIGLALLGVTDMISHQAMKKQQELEVDDALDSIVVQLFTSSYFLRAPNIRDPLARARHIYIDIQNRGGFQEHQDYFDLAVCRRGINA